MVLGAAVVAASLLLLGFTREIVGSLVRHDEQARAPTIVLAVAAIYVVDFAINVGTSSRALTPGPDDQPLTSEQSCRARGVSS